MCGRFTLITDPSEVYRRLAVPLPEPAFQPHYNFCPTQEAWGITQAGSCLMRWGLIPAWAKEISVGYKMINARAETIAEKPTFKRLLAQQRCLIPADGFYEWKKVDVKSKQPYRITRSDSALFTFAGLWDLWAAPDGSRLSSFTIITTEANEIVAPIHARMPVMLNEENEKRWLAEDLRYPEAMGSVLIAPPNDWIKSYPVSNAVSNVRNKSAECAAPLPS